MRIMSALGACALVMALAWPTQAADVDWKLYGSYSDGKSLCFYEANSVAYTSSGYIRVWMKCLPRKALDVKLDGAVGKMVIDHAVQKEATGYIPPVMIAEHSIDKKQLVSVLLYEQSADLRNIDPDTRMFLELSCSERKMRTLSAFVRGDDGRSGSLNKPSEWDYVPPEGSAATLLKILCR